MKIDFDSTSVGEYRSNSQIARVLTEKWISDNMYCPRCGAPKIEHFENNRPVADFWCLNCNNQYELKSKNGNLGEKITDGAYETMIERITGNQNPDFLFMSYSKRELKVKDLIFIPKHFFVPEIIEKRKPLSDTARRAGWIGCNILIDKIPEQGKIYIVSDGNIQNEGVVLNSVKQSARLEIVSMANRGWLMDILNCINKIPKQIFTLNDVYAFEDELQKKHLQNNNVKPKIRQQLQFLRDKGFISFLGNGCYKKIFDK